MERFIGLYETVYKDLYYLAFYYLGNPQDAEDARKESELVEELSYHPSLEDCVETRELLLILTEEERLIVALYIFGGYKGKEIARLLNLSHSTVRSKYRRALKKLEQQVLSEEVQNEK